MKKGSGRKGDNYVVLDAKVLEHDNAIRELRETVIVLQRDQANLEKNLAEMKDDFKDELRQSESRLTQAFNSLKSEVVDAFKTARAEFPARASLVIAGLGVVVAIIGIFHH